MRSKFVKLAVAIALGLALALTFSCSSGDDAEGDGSLITGNDTSGTFVDNRDSKSYKWVRIGGQVWMAENLNYDVPDNDSDVCYDNNSANCEIYGRLYNWNTAMVELPDCDDNSCKHRGICPLGWHIPSDADWNVLMKFINPKCSANDDCAEAGTKLKATSGWEYNGTLGNGTDDYGFSALPGGGGYPVGNFIDFGGIGKDGFWWNSSNPPYRRWMDYLNEYVYRNPEYVDNSLQSVRCLKD